MKSLQIYLILAFLLSLNMGCAALQVPEVADAERRLADLHAAGYGACADAAIQEAVAALVAAQTSRAERDAELARWQALTAISNTREGHMACQVDPILSCPPPPPCGCEANARADAQKYIVERGDCLWNIAKKPSIYNDPFLWPLICHANGLHNCDLIFPKQQLNIPDSGDFPIDELRAIRRTAGAR
jgi:nucleoid-associated protein YgaU